MDSCYYETLGVDKDADEKTIKHAYRKLVKLWHPDRHQNKSEDEIKQATEKFKEIQEAYEVLSDPEKRQIYNTQGKEGLKNSGYEFNVEAFFRHMPGFGDMFGMPGFGPQRPSIPPVKVKVELTLEELYTGTEIEHEIERRDLCTACDATGNKDKQKHDCGNCKGTGSIPRVVSAGRGMHQIIPTSCNVCNGTGRDKDVEKCSVCNGEHSIVSKYTLKMPIKPGMAQGQRIRVPNCGHELPFDMRQQHVRGPVEVIIIEKPHKLFERHVQIGSSTDPSDLCMEITVSLGEALCGIQKTFTHLDGRKLCIVENDNIKNGDIKIIPGKGMPKLNIHRMNDAHIKTHMGDLYVVYKIIYPKLSQNIKKKVYKLLTGKPLKRKPVPSSYTSVNTIKLEEYNRNQDHEHTGSQEHTGPQECSIQ